MRDFLVRTLFERLARNRVLTRRLPAALGSRPIVVSPDAQLGYLKPGAAAFDAELLRVASEHIAPGDEIWDIGANVGVFTLAAAVAARPGRVLAVEADTWLAGLIRASAAHTKNRDLTIDVLSAAIADRDGVGTFLIAQRGRSSSSLELAGGRSQMGGVRTRLLVPMLTLDTLLAAERATRPAPALVKIDVEGAELAVLRGAPRLLAEARPKLYIEVGREAEGAVGELLGAAGVPAVRRLEAACRPAARLPALFQHSRLARGAATQARTSRAVSGRRMRILQVIPTYLPAWRHGGPIYAVHGLSKALIQAGHEVEVFTTNVHGNGRLAVATGVPQRVDGVPVTYFPVRFPHRLHRAPAMGRALRRRVGGFDLVHLHSLFLWPTAAAARAAERAGVPYLVAPRGMLVPDLVARQGRWRKRLWLWAVERRTLEHAAALHVTGALEASEAARFGYHLPRIVEVPNGLDATELILQPGATPSAKIADQISSGVDLLFLGRVSWKKGLDRLLPALPLLPGARLVVAGNDEENLIPKLEAQARELDVAERVHFVGPVAGADKAALLAAARCFVLPSYSENFGNAVLEAMAVGLPVVVTPEVGLATTVEETGAGRVVPGESTLWAAALAELLANETLRLELGKRGRAVVEERFGWAAIAARMAEVYRELVEYPSPHG